MHTDNPIKKYLYIILGIISTALGVVGAFLPLLPTTPFLLLAAFLFSRSSQRCHQMLMNHRIFGTYLKNYIENKGITKKHRFRAIVLMWIVLLISSAHTWQKPLVLGILAIVGIGVTIHLSRLNTIQE